MDLQKTGGNVDRGENGQFKPGRSGNPSGRPKGSKNRATKLREELLDPILPVAIDKLKEAVDLGEKWAIEMTVSYCLPKPKPIDSEEMDEIEQRLAQLEEVATGRTQ